MNKSNDGGMTEAEEKEIVQGIVEAWEKYTWLFGGPPHGTFKQVHAMMPLGISQVVNNAKTQDRQALKDERIKTYEILKKRDEKIKGLMKFVWHRDPCSGRPKISVDFRQLSIRWAEHSINTYADELLVKALLLSKALIDFENELKP